MIVSSIDPEGMTALVMMNWVRKRAKMNMMTKDFTQLTTSSTKALLRASLLILSFSASSSAASGPLSGSISGVICSPGTIFSFSSVIVFSSRAILILSSPLLPDLFTSVSFTSVFFTSVLCALVLFTSALFTSASFTSTAGEGSFPV